MRRRLISLCIAAIITAFAATAATAAGEPDYYQLLARLKNNDTKVDFLALRLAYTRTADYKPYAADGSAKDAAFAALQKKDFAEAVRLAQAALEKNYVDLDAHLLCRIAYREMGDSDRYNFHSAVLKGLVGSLYASGDGMTPETAIVVISVPEEYFLLNANGLRSTKSTAIGKNGHEYDMMDVESKKTGEKKTLYFNTDIPRRWLTKSFQKK